MKKGITRKSILKRNRCHGFRKRQSTVGGSKVLKSRRQKGRRQLTP